MNLKDKIALVTGASRGIGAATARALAAHGATVAVNYWQSKDAAESVVADIKAGGGKAAAIKANVTSEADVRTMVKTITSEMGPVDFLILNAGMPVPLKPFAELSYDEFRTKVMGEMDCFFYALKEIIPSMVERRQGHIIGISSGLSRRPGFAFSAHTTAKSAVDGLMKSLALELGPFGILVNTVAPGLTMTDATSWIKKEQIEATAAATPLKRVGQPEDIAGAVVMLLGDEARFVTGAYIAVSGGSLML